jgi:REP element-mobilizing transposase RayT
MSTPREPFESLSFYHIFNHARGKDNIFEKESDYQTFLDIVERYILPIAQIYAYCLMPNHFHFLVEIKDIFIPKNFKKKELNDYVAHQWGNLQNTFTKKMNFQRNRRGGLFCQSINRNLITSEKYLQMGIVYIHNNPVKHGFCSSPEKWKYSSYLSILSERPTKVKRDEVLSWFENKENFIDYHNTCADEIYREKFKIN